MDFDMIEGMSNEKIENMYDIYNNDILDNGGTRSAYCQCITGANFAFIGFGDRSYGGCALMNASITTYDACKAHCRSKGFEYLGHSTFCWCVTTGRESKFTECKR